MRGFMLIAVLFFTSATVASAEEPSLWVGGMSVKLGMPQSEVLRQLQKNYKVSEPNDRGGMWPILDRKTNELKGAVTFKAGKVSWVTRDWGSFEGQGLKDFTQALFSVIANLNEEGQHLASVTTSTQRSPQVVLDTVTLRFSTKALILHLGRSEKVVDASIQETLFGTK